MYKNLNMIKKYFYACACLLLIWSYALQAQMVWEQSTGTSTCFSSARATDLNGDGVKDFVIGGGIESIFDAQGNIVQTPSDYMVTAINGATGDWLWNVEGMDQIFGSPIFLDVTGDGTDDVFVGGRNGYFLCIDGASGEVYWQYYEGSNGQNASNVGLYNFYNAQWVPDQNADGYKDLLVSNGGDRVLPPWETERPAGKLMVIDPVNGALLGSADMPDGKETYMSPVVYDFFRDGKLDVIFGTGGETISGSLFRAPLSDVMRGDLSNATTIIQTATKGFIAPPSLADLTGDNIPELITNTYEGHIIATDGWTNEVLWDYTVEGAETNASPAIGLFNGDNVPDVFTSFLIGVAPTYSGAVQLMIDGATGEKVYENDLGFLQYSSPVVYDLNSDGVHEAIGMINNVGDTFSHDIIAFDFANGTETSLLDEAVGGTNIASTPWIGNLDNDGVLDMFYAHHADETVFISDQSITFKRISLGVTDTNHVAWGGYMGTDGDGFFDNEQDSCFQTLWVPTTYAISPTCKGGDDGEAQINSNGCPCQFSTCVYQWSNGDSVKHTYNLEAGEHFVTLIHEDGCVMVHRVTIEDPTGPETVMEQSLCAGANMGSISVLNINDTIPYLSYDWSTGETTPSISNLGGGIYTVTVLSPDSCLEVLEFELIEPAIFEMEEPLMTNISCNGETDGSLVLSPTGGTPPYTLNLDDGTNITAYTFDDEITLEDLPTGTYIYDIREANGCGVLQGFVDIVEPVVLERELTVQNINCEGDLGGFEVSLSGGTAPFQYVSWTGALSDPFDQAVFEFTDLEAGLYSMEFLDANGCSVTVNAIIEETESFLQGVSNIQPINCFGDLGAMQVNIEGGTPPYQYTWNGTTSDPTTETAFLFNDLEAGNYMIEITDANGCLVETSGIVEAVAELTVDIEVMNADNEISTDGMVNFAISGGTAPFSYDFGGGNAGTSENGIVNLAGYGVGDYSLEIMDANGCEFSTNVSVAANNLGTSVEDLKQSHIAIYPNPNQGQFVIESTDFSHITIFDAVGKTMSFEKVVVENGKTVVSVINASKGVYFIRLDGNDVSVLEKVVIF